MPLAHANADGARLDDSGGTAARLRAALAGAGSRAPVAILVHGFQYSPADPARCPHRSLFSPGKAYGWPQRLGHGEGNGAADAPLCIGFGWESRGSIWAAYGRAARAGRALAELVELAAALMPGRRITLLAHSLGARVALQSLPHLQAGALSRAILMAGAEFRHRALAAADCPAGRAADFLNVTSAQNRPYDLLLEYAFSPALAGRPAMGRGMRAPRWTDLSLTCPATRAALERAGHPVGAPARRICHGATYLTPGLFPLYRAALSDPSLLPRLGAALPAPRKPARRLLPHFALPAGRHTPS